jgi:signal transduction histidine kinase
MQAEAGWRSLSEWLWTGWPPGVRPSAEDEIAFVHELRARSARDVQFVIVVLMLFDVMYWLTDPWLLGHRPEVVVAFAYGRGIELLLGALALVAVRAAPQAVYAIGLIGGSAGLFALSWTMARCGGPSTPWYYFLLPFPFAATVAYLRPIHRAAVVLILGAAVVGGYFGTHPEYLRDPLTGMAIAHLGWLLCTAWISGAWFDTFRARLFLSNRRLAEERARLAERVAEQTESLRALVHRTETIREAERTSIARDLHDDLGQTITAARMILKHARTRPDPAGIGANLDMLAHTLDQVHTQTRRILHNLRPALLDGAGVEEALEALAARASEGGGGFVVRYAPQGVSVPEEIAVAAWRCAQEALTNVARHAGASRVDLTLTRDGDTLRLIVEDDGRGFDPAVAHSGLGLLGIRERAAISGGSVDITSRPGRGSRVEIRWPVEEGT